MLAMILRQQMPGRAVAGTTTPHTHHTILFGTPDYTLLSGGGLQPPPQQSVQAKAADKAVHDGLPPRQGHKHGLPRTMVYYRQGHQHGYVGRKQQGHTSKTAGSPCAPPIPGLVQDYAQYVRSHSPSARQEQEAVREVGQDQS